MKKAPLRNDACGLGDLTPDPRNARKHTPKNIGMISDSLRSVGAGRSIVIDENNEILAGNGLCEAAAEVGITKVQVVEADGETIIAVRRRGLTPEQKTKLALYDNRASELAEWNLDVLREFSAEGMDLRPFEFDEKTLNDLKGSAEAEIAPLTIDRPADVVWVLVAIPVEDWPKHQSTIEGMQVAAKFCTMVLRPRE